MYAAPGASEHALRSRLNPYEVPTGPLTGLPGGCLPTGPADPACISHDYRPRQPQ